MEKQRMTEHVPPIGVVETLAPGVRRIIAPNASPMTYWGTNSYLIGEDDVMVIDPGPLDDTHLTRMLEAVEGASVSHILITHSHLDHSPLAKVLSETTGAPVHAFGDSGTGKSDTMLALEASGLSGGGEGVDRDFQPDHLLAHGEVTSNAEVSVTAWHTPGHMGNHMCFQMGHVVFTGDLIMGWASTMVSPPDGDLGDFLESCRLMKTLDATQFFPGHGAPIDDPNGRINWLLDHRAERTKQVMTALNEGPADIATLTAKIYTDAPKGLLAAAARNVFAHLIDLHQKGHVVAAPALGPDAIFELNAD